MKISSRELKLLLLFVTMDYVYCKVYNIIPNSINYSCIEDPCLTLSQMNEELSIQIDKNITLAIVGGNHTLHDIVNVSKIEYFTILAASNNTRTTITCRAAAHFNISHIHSVNISGLTFIGCGNNRVTFVHHLIVEDIKSLGRESNGTFLIIDHSSAELTKTFISNKHGKPEKNNIDRYLTYLQSVSLVDYKEYGSIRIGGAMIVNYSNLTVNNCTFDGNSANIGGAIFSDFESHINISSSKFIFNQAMGCNELGICFGLGGALFIGGNSTVIIHNSTFDNNMSGVDGGMAGIFNASLFIFGSQASNNIAMNNGGVIATFIDSYLHMDNTMFHSNVAQYNGGVIATTKDTTTAISHCNFMYNSAGEKNNTQIINIVSHGDNVRCNSAIGNGGVAFAEYSASVIVRATLFINNSATGNGGVMHAHKHSYLDIKNCTILKSSAASGGVFFARDGTNIFISKRSHLEGNIAELYGGIVRLEDGSNITIKDSIIGKNDARHGGVIFSQENSWILIHGTTLRSNRANRFGGVIHALHNSSVLINDSTFDSNYAGNNGGVFDCFNATSIRMYRSNFTHNYALLKGGVLVMTNENSKDSQISTTNEVKDCTFSNNSATYGGVFALQRKVNMTIQRSNFNSNTANTDGGVINIVHNSSVFVNESIFDSNYAENNGGVFDCLYATSIRMYGSKFMHNFAQLKGGILVITNANLKDSQVSTTNEVKNCTFSNNSAPYGGVFALQRKVNMTIQRSNFNSNTAKTDGGILHALIRCRIAIYNSSFNDTMAVNNGVLLASYNCNITIYGSQFNNNTAGFNGGVIYVVDKCNTMIKDCKFISNQANDSGGVIYERRGCLVTIKNSLFNQSVAFNSGGVVHAHGFSKVMLNGSNFTNNAADYGGVIRVYENSKATIAQCTFKVNQASTTGGAMAAYKSSTLTVEDSLFIQNIANIGGVAMVFQAKLLSDSGGKITADYGREVGRSILNINTCEFLNNSADYGGVIYVQGSTATINSSTLNWNTARFFGGVISANANSTVTLNMNNISHNIAKKRGGVMSLSDGNTVNIAYNFFTSNSAQNKGGVFSIQDSEALISNTIFKSSTVARGTGGVIYASNSSLQIEHSSFMENNASSNGGAVHVVLNTIMEIIYCNFTSNTANGDGGALILEDSSQGTIVFCLLQQNVANCGGALAALSNCSVYFEREALTRHLNETQILSNTARISGGGIYLHESSIHFRAETNICSNQAQHSGGGIHASESAIGFGSNIKFENNIAKKGGGISLTASDLYSNRLFQSVSVSFAFNTASFGGALFVLDSPYFCSEPKSQGCFFQNITQNFLLEFSNNTANYTGSDLYGGQLDICSINNDMNRTEDGIARWKAISNLTDLNTVSSQPTRVCRCKNSKPDCNERTHSVQIKQGEAFNISFVVVDQVRQPVDSIVLSTLNRSDDASSQQTRAFYSINASCYDLNFNISFPTACTTHELTIANAGHNNATCEDEIISNNFIIFINVISCSCPPGFMPAGIRGVCYCSCDKRDGVFSRYIKNCNYEKQTVIRKGVFWITYLNDSDTSGYLFFPYCPLEYCQPPSTSVNVNLSQPNGSDAQCVNNRIGLLCGSCPHDYSLSLGSAKCIVCPSNWHGLLVVIVLAACIAGIVLVLSLLVFNLTVAVGTLNSIIFYANIIYANKSLYFGHSHFMLIQVITSWLNLDIGFDTCFFDGMDTYAKTWLQLAFPMYIIALIIAIILISSCSSKFSHMIGRKDPVATLATLILLSYTKLLQIVITSSSYVKVEFPNGTSTIRWIHDASIEFGTGKSIALICIALVILLLGLLYTILVFSWQCLVKCPRSRLLGWTRNHKLSSFINTYHIPHATKHRYWPGLLLLIRVIVYLIAVFSASSDQPVTLLCTIVIMCCLLFYKNNLGMRVYQNWLLNAMESFIYFNILIFAVFTMFTFISSSVGDGGKESLQRDVANLSIGSVLLLILIIIIFHVYRYGNAKFYTLVERMCPCRLFKGYNQNRNRWKLLDNPLLDVIDDPRDDSNNVDYMPSSMVLPTRSTVSMADVEGASVAVSMSESIDESIKASQPSTMDNRPFNTSTISTIQKADSSSFFSPNKKLSSIKQPLLI